MQRWMGGWVGAVVLWVVGCGGQTTSNAATGVGGAGAVAGGAGVTHTGGSAAGGVASGGVASGGTTGGGAPSSGGAGGAVTSLNTVWSVEADNDETVQWDGIRALAASADTLVFVANHWTFPDGAQTGSATELDANGQAIWTQPLEVEAIDIAIGASAPFALSRTNDPIYALATKLSSSGSVWKKPAIASKQGGEPSALGVDEYGRAIVVGSVYSDESPPGPHPFVTQLASDGGPVWTYMAKAATSGVATDVAVSSSFQSVATLEFSGSLDFQGNTQSGFGAGDLAVARWSSGGSLLWVQNLSTALNEKNSRVALDASGNAIVVWTADGALSAQKLAVDGTTTWKRQFDSAKADALAVAVGVDGIFVAGTFIGSLELGDQVWISDPGASYGETFVVKLDFQGEPIASLKLPWAPTSSFCGQYRPVSIACDLSGNVYLAGGACLGPGSQLLKLAP